MKVDLEQKLKELWQESLDQNALSIHVVTHLLLASYQNGTHSDFAKWCSRYVSGLQMNATVNGGLEPLPDDFPFRTGQKEWVC
jgi:hypothetical protein